MYSEPTQTSKMEFFPKIINDWKQEKINGTKKWNQAIMERIKNILYLLLRDGFLLLTRPYFWKHRTKVGPSYSKWSETCRRIPQGSILDHYYVIFINNILFFVEKSEICNFADDSTTYSRGKDLPTIKEDLICAMKSILKWFRLNSLKANPRKF